MNDIPKYINDWLNIIENMNTDNTYKIVWGRSILECIHHKSYEVNEKIIVSFNDIATNIIKYYWNQLFFFNLKQAIYIDKEPVVCTEVKKLINRYKEIKNTEIPVWFDKGISVIKQEDIELYNKVHKKIVQVLHYDVCYRFKRVSKGELDIYSYTKKVSNITFNIEDVKLLNDYNIILAELFNFKWSQLLEKYNHQPKISSKVKGTAINTLKRNSLKEYRDILLNQFKDGNIIDFYTNEIIEVNDISIDHVIPWSFIYSDDIWNLVITSKSYNSTKSNSIPNISFINKLNERNKELFLSIDDKKKKDDLKYAIDNNLVNKYYYDCKV